MMPITRRSTCAVRRSVRLLLLLAVSACRNGSDTPPPDPPGAPAPAVASTRSCENPQAGYAVEYPAGWRTNSGEVVPPCSLFDPEPIRIEPASEVPAEIAVAMGREAIPFEQAAAESIGERHLSREETMVAGRRAARIEAVSTGEGLLDRGIRSYRYVIDLGGEIVSAVTHDAGTLAYGEKKRALDGMMAALRIEPAP